jgi:hypothetical protein
MQKILLALLVLAIAVPAMAASDVTITLAKTPEVNAVVVGYSMANSKEARAFPLNIAVTDKALWPGKVLRLSSDYYVTPTNVQFLVVGGTTWINQLGSPMVLTDPNGGIVEMASLYAVNDPCGHTGPPPVKADLVKFYVNNDCNKAGADRKITFAVTQNAQRGNIVLKDPNVIPTVTLPAATFYIPCIACTCMKLTDPNTICGGVPITKTRYNNWVQIGKPQSWCHPGHYAGDASLDCKVTSADVVGPALPNFIASFNKTWPDPAYQAACDVTEDKKITSADVLGTSSIPNSGLKPNFNKTILNCP